MTGTATHNPAVALTAQFVAAGAEDELVAAIFRALLPVGYDGNSLEELPEWLASARRKSFGEESHSQIDDRIARVIEHEMRPIHFVPGDGFLQYSDGYWQQVTNSVIDRLAKELLAVELPRGRGVLSMLPNVRGCLRLNVEKPGFGAPRQSEALARALLKPLSLA